MFKSKASILILTLWTISFLGTIIIILSFGIRQKLSLAARLQERQKAYLFAEAGLMKGIAFIKDIDDKEQISLKNLKADDSTRIMFAQENLYAHYEIVDEQSKINLNKAKPQILERLFILLGFNQEEAQQMSASIIDWRDLDATVDVPVGSAEDYFYEQLDFPYEAKDSDFEVLEELLLLKNIDQQIYERIKDYFTIYGNGKININTASSIVLRAIGIDNELVEKIIEYRNGKDKTPLSPDDNIFEEDTQILDKITSFKKLNPEEMEKLSLIIEEYLTTNSEVFKIISFCRDKKEKIVSKIDAIVNRKGEILSIRSQY